MGKDPLPDEEIAAHLAELPGWDRGGDTITGAFSVRYHGGVALIVNVADIERPVGHHADIDLRWDHVRFRITTHDAGHRLTAADFELGPHGSIGSRRRIRHRLTTTEGHLIW